MTALASSTGDSKLKSDTYDMVEIIELSRAITERHRAWRKDPTAQNKLELAKYGASVGGRALSWIRRKLK